MNEKRAVEYQLSSRSLPGAKQIRKGGICFALWPSYLKGLTTLCGRATPNARIPALGSSTPDAGSASLPSGELQNPNSSKQSLFASIRVHSRFNVLRFEPASR
jgi:hypothetical protein